MDITFNIAHLIICIRPKFCMKLQYIRKSFYNIIATAMNQNRHKYWFRISEIKWLVWFEKLVNYYTNVLMKYFYLGHNIRILLPFNKHLQTIYIDVYSCNKASGDIKEAESLYLFTFSKMELRSCSFKESKKIICGSSRGKSELVKLSECQDDIS